MTERDTTARLRAALVSRAELAMSTTDTSKELERLRQGMRPARMQRRRRILVAAAAAAVIVGGGIGLGLGLSGSGNDTHRIVPDTHPSQTTTAPTDFPTGTYVRPGSNHRTELELSTTGAILRKSGFLLTARLTFPTAGQVQFSCIAGRHAPCASPCPYTYHQSGSTLTLQLVRKSTECTSNDFIARAPWRKIG